MRGETLTINQPITFRVESCCNCGVFFGITSDLYDQLQRAKEQRTFYCPNGHPQFYVGKSDEQKAKEAQRALREAEIRLQAERDQRLASEREFKRHQKRAKGGVCPCCKRSFVQLARHMKTQHPKFAQDEVASR